MDNKSKNELNEDISNENYDLWRNHKITDAEYFREISRTKNTN